MRIPFPKEVEEMQNQINPYIVMDGAKWHLREDAPEHIVKVKDKLMAILDAEFKKAEALL